ncbi:MAG: hypothetical protein Q8933_20060 [Bacteroidota bacterium]|nr:hypothetical protein [Bacteroidota bacterium]
MQSLTKSFIVDACRQLHPETVYDVEAVTLESLKYRQLALAKDKANIDNREDIEIYYMLKNLKDKLLIEAIEGKNV